MFLVPENHSTDNGTGNQSAANLPPRIPLLTLGDQGKRDPAAAQKSEGEGGCYEPSTNHHIRILAAVAQACSTRPTTSRALHARLAQSEDGSTGGLSGEPSTDAALPIAERIMLSGIEEMTGAQCHVPKAVT